MLHLQTTSTCLQLLHSLLDGADTSYGDAVRNSLLRLLAWGIASLLFYAMEYAGYGISRYMDPSSLPQSATSESPDSDETSESTVDQAVRARHIFEIRVSFMLSCIYMMSLFFQCENALFDVACSLYSNSWLISIRNVTAGVSMGLSVYCSAKIALMILECDEKRE